MRQVVSELMYNKTNVEKTSTASKLQLGAGRTREVEYVDTAIRKALMRRCGHDYLCQHVFLKHIYSTVPKANSIEDSEQCLIML